MRRILFALIAAGLALPAAADTYTLDSSHTFPRWAVSHFGLSTHRGQFNRTSGKLTLDAKGNVGAVEVTIDTASISTGDPKLEEHLRNADFFDVEKFPAMTFKSKAMKFERGRPSAVTGDLTLLGVTKPVTLRVARVKCIMHSYYKREVCGAEISGKLRRSDFGMKYGLPAVGDEVSLLIQVEAIKD